MSAFFHCCGLSGPPLAEEFLVCRQISCLLAALEAVPDPHDPRGVRFDLPLLMGLAVFAACCGARTFDEVAEVVADLPDLLAAGFGLVRTAPSAATFRRIINATDPTALDEALSAWAAGPAASEPATSGQARPTVSGVSLDGKTMRGAKMFDAAGAMTQAAALEALDQSPLRGGRMATRPKSTTTYPLGGSAADPSLK